MKKYYKTSKKQREYQKFHRWELYHLTRKQRTILTIAERRKLYENREK